MRAIALFLLTLCYAPLALAGWVFTANDVSTTTLSPKSTMTKRCTSKSYIEGNNARIDSVCVSSAKPGTEEKNTTIMSADHKRMWMIDYAQKSYIEMGNQEAEALEARQAQMMKEMKGRLDKIPPEVRAKMQKYVDNAQNPQFSYTPTGKTAQVHGRECRMFRYTENGKQVGEVCMTSLPEKLPAMEDMFSVRPITKAVKAMREAQEAAAGPNPVILSSTNHRGVSSSTMEMTDISQQAIPASYFDLPAGYTKTSLNSLSAPAKMH